MFKRVAWVAICCMLRAAALVPAKTLSTRAARLPTRPQTRMVIG